MSPRATLMTLVVLGVALCCAAPAGADEVETIQKIGSKIKEGWKKYSESHPNEPPFELKGKLYWVLTLRDEDGARCTNNFKEPWKDKFRNFTLHIVNVDNADLRAKMRFQLMDDLKGEPDKAFGDPIPNHGGLSLAGGHDRLYFNQGGFEMGPDLKADHRAAILLVEEGLTLEEVLADIASRK